MKTLVKDSESGLCEVKVMFRYEKDGGVYALMPEICGTYKVGTCQCYQHVGQHSSADLQYCIAKSRPATPAEYAGLLAELLRLGYAVTVIQRTPANAFDLRMAELNR